MAAAHAVTLIAVFLAIIVVALFLITVTYQLHMVHKHLNVILGVVVDVGEKTTVLDPVISEITNDLAAGNAAVKESVQRLASRKGVELPAEEEPVGAVAENGMPSPATVPGPPPITFRNY